MNAILIILALGAGAYLLTMKNTVQAAKNLKYKINKVQIRKFNLLNPIQVRCIITFTNLEKLPIVIQQVFLTAYLSFETKNGQPVWTRFAELNGDKGYTIPANKTTDINFDVEVRWRDLGSNILKMLQGVLTGGGIKLPTKALVKGQIKAEGFTIQINEEVPFGQN